MTQNPYALEHSLELYEQYPTVRCRPACTGPVQGAPLRVSRPRWAEISPEKGVFHFERLDPPGAPGDAVLLCADLTPPAWARDMEDAAAFVRLLGAELAGGAAYAGALVGLGGVGEGARPALLRAWRAGFDKTALLARAGDALTIGALRREGISFGLALDASQGILHLREALARNGLQRVWESAPVVVLTAGCKEGPEAVLGAAAGWHALAADIPGIFPGRMALRRLTYPERVTAGGALPLRFWWQVVGDSPVYGRTAVAARLVGQGGGAALGVDDCKPIRLPGDATHNRIVPLTALPPGEYTLQVAILGADGRPLPLAMDAPSQEGWYGIGAVTLDDEPRPELFAAWDHYYPEGYYPLEDPKLPY